VTQIAELAAMPTGAQVTEVARRRARFRYAMDRVRKIAQGTPEFTGDELAELAEVFTARAAGLEPKAPPHTCGEAGYTSRDICIACQGSPDAEAVAS
jgi:hypothetical protein